jgi:hypothetical protein
MADSDITRRTHAKLARVTVRHGAAHDTLTGDKASLMAHPACPPTMFYGEGTAWKAAHTIRLSDGRKVTLRRTGSHYSMLVELTVADRLARRARRDRLETVERAVNQSKEALARMPRTAADYRREALESAKLFEKLYLSAADGALSPLRGGYSLDAAARKLVEIHLQALRAVFETGGVVLDCAQRQELIDAAMAPARNADPTFRRVLDDLTKDGGR